MGRLVAAARNGGGAQLRMDTGRWTVTRRNDFLAALAQTANVRLAVRSVGMSEPGAYKLRQRDAAFAKAWGEALCEGYEKLEMLMLRRGLAGLDGDVIDPGDGSKAAALSERSVISLLNHHRQSVREIREAAARQAERGLAGEGADARARLEAKLAQMHARMASGDDDA